QRSSVRREMPRDQPVGDDEKAAVGQLPGGNRGGAVIGNRRRTIRLLPDRNRGLRKQRQRSRQQEWSNRERPGSHDPPPRCRDAPVIVGSTVGRVYKRRRSPCLTAARRARG